MKKELVINQHVLALEFLDLAIDHLQKHVLMLDSMNEEVDPNYALKELQAAFTHAARLAKDLLPENFEVPTITKQRKAIQRQLRKE